MSWTTPSPGSAAVRTSHPSHITRHMYFFRCGAITEVKKTLGLQVVELSNELQTVKHEKEARSSLVTCHTSHITHHTSHIGLQVAVMRAQAASEVMLTSSLHRTTDSSWHHAHVTRHTSHVTHHTSHVTHTRHTSHITYHTKTHCVRSYFQIKRELASQLERFQVTCDV
jgi:hypothetical protein